MPNIPNVPGVPALRSYLPSAVELLTTSLVSFLLGSVSPAWGIFLDGAPAFDFESTVKFDFGKDWMISDYPVEAGSFQSYDKVEEPFDVRVTMTSAGDPIARQQFLQEVLTAAATLNLYDVVTPDAVFQNCNIRHVDYQQRSDSGVGLIIMNIYLIQIRQSASTTFQNTQQPGEAGQRGSGNVQAEALPPLIQQRFDSAGGAT